MPIGNVLTLEDLSKIEAFLEEEGYADMGLEIVIPVREPVFKKVNEEMYYMNNSEGVPPDVDEIEVRIGGVNFKYVVREDAV